MADDNLSKKRLRSLKEKTCYESGKSDHWLWLNKLTSNYMKTNNIVIIKIPKKAIYVDFQVVNDHNPINRVLAIKYHGAIFAEKLNSSTI